MKVLLVDDHPPIRRGLRHILELRDGFQVVGEGSNGVEAIAKVEELRPDLVLMDMNMPVMNGVEATAAIKSRWPEVQVLALTAFGEMSLVAAMVKAGAAGYLLKGGSPEELVESLRAVSRGQGALDPEVTRGVMKDMAALYKKEQERADALAELDRMKSEFVAVVSHELRTPLTSIKGGIVTLQRGWAQLPDAIRGELFDSIHTQCDRLESMVEKILVVAGIQHGGLGLIPTNFSLREVAHEALEIMGPQCHGRKVDVRLDDADVTGDRERIREVALSLIDNAVNFTGGPITVHTGHDGAEATLSVADHGPGLAANVIDSLIGRPFVQGDSTTTREVGGLGLSLYVARQVLEASGGRLAVDTAPDRGSTFSMILALRAAA